MRPMEVSMAFLCQIDKYHFQLRTGPETLGALGKIGCFGGQIRKNETAKEAVSREIAEETNVAAMPENFHFLGTVDVISDRDDQEVAISAWVFKLLLPIGSDVQAEQGELITFGVENIRDNLDQLTPATRAAVEKWF